VSVATASFPLFVPANRPALLEKACASGADAVILDLEDAVPAADKDGARQALVALLGGSGPDRACPVWVRINAQATRWHGDDLDALGGLPVAAIMVPKAEAPEALRAVAERAPGCAVVALVETARGVAAARTLGAACQRLAFGAIDLAADLGCADSREPMLAFRSELVLAARLAGQPGPLDGVTTALRDAARIEEDARHARLLGFGGKLLIHPAQLAPARAGFAPDAAERAWAQAIVAASAGTGAAAVDGEMVDAPVLARARFLLALHEKASR